MDDSLRELADRAKDEELERHRVTDFEVGAGVVVTAAYYFPRAMNDAEAESAHRHIARKFGVMIPE